MGLSRDMLPNVFRQDAIDERLVPHVPARGFFPQLSQDFGIQSDRDQLASAIAQRGAADASHRAQLVA